MDNKNRTTNNIKKGELKSIRQPNKKKARMQEKIEKAVDKMVRQGQMWEMATKSYQDLNPYYIVDENGKSKWCSDAKTKKAGVITAFEEVKERPPMLAFHNITKNKIYPFG